jgi:FixJ family two-component response regulator
MNEFCLVQIDTHEERRAHFAALANHAGLPWRCHSHAEDIRGEAFCEDIIVFIELCGTASCKEIEKLCSHGISTVAYSEHTSHAQVYDCLCAGAIDYLEWRKPDDFASRLNVVLCKHEALRGVRKDRSEASAKVAELSKRERQVLCAILAGGTSKLIARLWNISFRTVEIHRQNLKKKLGCQHTGEIFAFGVQAGLIGPVMDDARILEPRGKRFEPGSELP